MPKVTSKSTNNSGKGNVLNMMGYGNDDDDDSANTAFEQELAALMGGGSTKKTAKKSPAKKLVDWSVLNSQVEESLRDIDEDGDIEVTSDDENDLMGELNEIVGEDESNQLTVNPTPLRRSPSPVPANSGSDTLAVLTSRKEMYETGIKQSTVSSKTRRLQRGLKQLDEMIKKVKRGKSIPEDDIPPPIAVASAGTTKQPATILPSTEVSSPQTPVLSVSEPVSDETTAVPVPTVVKPTPSQAPTLIQPSPILHPTPSTAATPDSTSKISAPSVQCSVSDHELKMLEERKNEYKVAAMKAKKENNRELALDYFRTLKQIDFVITSAKEGKTVDLAQMPASPSEPDSQNVRKQPAVEVKQQQQQPSQQQPAQQPATTAAVAAPKTTAEHLTARLQVYQTSANEANKEGNSSKARRMMRIVKQYQSALKSHNSGKKVDFQELPCPPGFPPMPGQSQQPVNIMERAAQLASADPDAEEHDNTSKQPPAGQSPNAATRPTASPTAAGTSTSSKPQTAYNAQLTFLQNRQTQFRQAALLAKQDGNRELALNYLRNMKKFDPLIEAAKSGMKVDISKVPQPPIISKNDRGFEIIEKSEVENKKYETLEAKDDAELYSRIVDILSKQVKKARLYSEQMSHASDVRAAQLCDSLATSSQADLDYIVSCRRHKDAPPRFYYVEKQLKCMDINPDIGENELELIIVQCIGVAAVVKDNKTFVEWEMPFPHDNPVKGQTEESRPSPKPSFPNSTFRVPFNRKAKSNQRAIKNKSLRLNFVAKGGFMRSAKVLGTCNVKLAPLDTTCTFHAVEKLKDGRNHIGEIEFKVNLRTPITSSGPKTITEKWMQVEQKVRRGSAPSTSKVKPVPKSTPKPSSAKASSVNISSIQAATIDFKLISAQIDHHKKRNQQVPRDMLLEAKRIKNQIDSTRSYLQDGGRDAHREYRNCLSAQYQFLSKQADQYEKEGKPAKAKVSRKKKEAVGTELQKYKS